VPNLWVLAPGARSDESADLLDSYRLGSLVKSLGDVFDLVVIDSPPVMAVADASIIANAAVSVIFVIAVGATSPEAARSAADRLAAAQADVIGVVLNKAHRGAGYYYGYDTPESAQARAAGATATAGRLGFLRR
jgi:Mrp family chromosome partitioning ATPase